MGADYDMSNSGNSTVPTSSVVWNIAGSTAMSKRLVSLSLSSSIIIGLGTALAVIIAAIVAVFLILKKRRAQKSIATATKNEHISIIDIPSIGQPPQLGGIDNAAVWIEEECYQNMEVGEDKSTSGDAAKELRDMKKKHMSLPLGGARQTRKTLSLHTSDYENLSTQQTYFTRSSNLRRSKSCDSMERYVDEYMGSVDSGFCSAHSLNSPKVQHLQHHLTEQYNTLFTRCPPYYHESLSQFLDLQPAAGCQFSVANMVVGYMDSQGGTLKLASDPRIRLIVPPGALDHTQMIHMFVLWEDNQDSSLERYSPIIDCGPNGLQFKIPVELCFPHAASEADVKAISRQDESAEWKEEDDGPEIADIDEDEVKFKINHFTGYQLVGCGREESLSRSSRSRIPIRRAGPPTVGMAKKISMQLFSYGQSAKLYLVLGTHGALHKFVQETEGNCGYKPAEPIWKDLKFVRGRGNLVIQWLDNSNNSIFPEISLSEEKIFVIQKESFPIIADHDVIMNVRVFQANDEGNCSKFAVKLSSDNQHPPLDIHTHPQTLHPVAQSTHGYQSAETRCERLQRSVSQVHSTSGFSAARVPVESCGCAGACNCSEADTTPSFEFSEEESETDLYRRSRNDPHRKSKESGYNSMVMSPLRGPNSIIEVETSHKLSKTPMSSSLDLTLDVDFKS